jgi:peptidoglycan/xylan/chitin deacetylase (PgdA/CDA1 family)
MRLDVCFTVDVEPDCPPFLSGYRGVEEGMPRLLAMLAEEDVPATFFTTGGVAQRYPGVVSAIVSEGHELASHGMTHRAFTQMTPKEAQEEIEESARILRRHAPVTSFRAPYLRFPHRYLSLLESSGFRVDSSQAKYKYDRVEGRGSRVERAVRRVPASVTSSVLRLPRVLRNPYLHALESPVVLFVHPWEFVDLRRERLRLDCRFRTGDKALACVRDVLRLFAARGGRFRTMCDLATNGLATAEAA